MVVMAYLLDTNVLIDYWRGFPPAVQFVDDLLDRATEQVLVSVITVAEAFSGQSSLDRNKRSDIDVLLRLVTPVDVDVAIAVRGGELRRDFGIEMTDALIAATAIAHGLALVTRNAKHFQNVPTLAIRDIT